MSISRFYTHGDAAPAAPASPREIAELCRAAGFDRCPHPQHGPRPSSPSVVDGAASREECQTDMSI